MSIRFRLFGFPTLLTNHAMIDKKRLVGTAAVVLLAVAAYYLYGYIQSDTKGVPEFIPDSVSFCRGCNHPDSACLRIDFAFPQAVGIASAKVRRVIAVDYGNWILTDKPVTSLNQLKAELVDYALGVDSSFVDFLENFGNISYSSWYVDVDYRIIRNDGKLLVIGYEYSQYMGGAHSNYGFHYQNIDLLRDELLSLKDVVTDSVGFARITREFLMRKADKYSFDLWPEVLSGEQIPIDEFAILPKGILLHFNPYDVTYFAAGDVRVLLPYDSLPGIVDYGCLERFFPANDQE